MADTLLNDAEALVLDACNSLAPQGNTQLVSMLSACTPISYQDAILTLQPPSSFAARVIIREKQNIEAVLQACAFENVTLQLTENNNYTQHLDHRSSFYSSYNNAELQEVLKDELSPVFTSGTTTPISGTATSITLDDLRNYQQSKVAETLPNSKVVVAGHAVYADELINPLIEPVAEKDATLTFETFVEADENRFALQAAKQVANGVPESIDVHATQSKPYKRTTLDQYNPLFIHGRSGLGKTHLLRAIQNYIALNDPERTCVYRIANDFIGDYTNALKNRNEGMMEALEKNYRGVDVLILDDVQHLKSATKTIEFFFDTFNYLIAHGKQIVLAADEAPGQLGMPERITSRMGQGLSVSVQTPSPEFKHVLIETFYERMKSMGGLGSEGTLSPAILAYMSERAGGNIRSIRSFVQDCLFRATQLEVNGKEITKSDINAAAQERWTREGQHISISDVQQLIEKQYGVSHGDLVGKKRSQEFMHPRHVAIWLCRELTDHTLNEIGKRFGGRTHATVKASIKWVEDRMESDRVFFDRLIFMRDRLGGE